MNKAEVIEKMMNFENGGLYAAIGGIVLVYGIDRVTKCRYKVDARKESFTLAPAAVTAGTRLTRGRSPSRSRLLL